jgi:plasmid maintenance system antidote protein VapI
MTPKFNANRTENSFHTGQMLKDFFAKKRIHKNALARHLGRGRTTLVNYQKNASMQTAILWEISTVLQHNFFADIACQLPPTFTTNAPQETASADRIAELQKKLEMVEAERNILLKAFSK